MTFSKLRSFAIGDLGWSLERYRNSTMFELSEALKGYWRNWERTTSWLARRLTFYLITGNPYIKDKPADEKELWRLKDDEEEDKIKAKEIKSKKLTKKEIEEVENILKHGIKRPDSKDKGRQERP